MAARGQAIADVRIRPATESDLPDLVRIDNRYITTSHTTLDTEPLDVEQRRAWFQMFSPAGPHRLLVAEHDAHAVGYASSRPLGTKPAYRRSVETTIFLDPQFAGGATGRALYGTLLQALEREDGVHRAYAGIVLPNPASIALHRKFGFAHIGIFHEVGYKFGKYWHVSWYEKGLASPGAT